ncbi:MAG: helix-turn-helix domain-containing protein [Candidatus Coproplasma sp.]
MSDMTENPSKGKLMNAVLEYVIKNNPRIVLSALTDNKALDRVFSDEGLVSSCMCLFENNLNVTLAAEKMYMHRNTLIYRIKKVERLTGLNVTAFSDAVDFIILYRAYLKKQTGV